MSFFWPLSSLRCCFSWAPGQREGEVREGGGEGGRRGEEKGGEEVGWRREDKKGGRRRTAGLTEEVCLYCVSLIKNHPYVINFSIDLEGEDKWYVWLTLQ